MVMGSASGGFMPTTHVTVGALPIQIEKADFNKDGKLDLAILSVGTSSAGSTAYDKSLYVLPGNGLGSFSSPFVVVSATTESNPHFTVGDFDGDSWSDLALLEPSQNRVRFALNARSPAAPAFAEATPLPCGEKGLKIAAADLNGDGKDDCALAHGDAASGGRVDVYLAGASVVAWSKALPCVPSVFSVASLDGDDEPDLAAAGERAGGFAACVLRGLGGGAFEDPVPVDIGGRPNDLACGDLNGDGAGDLLFVQTGEIRLAAVLVTKPAFIRGDTNGDAKVDISDAAMALRHIFGVQPRDCPEADDINDDRALNVADPIYLLAYLFASGPRPPAPFPLPGTVPEAESLGCERP